MIVGTNLTQGTNGAAGNTGTTASVSPAANALLLLTVTTYVSTGSVNPPDPTITGLGLTWVLIGPAGGLVVDGAGADRHAGWVFRAMGTPTPGTILIDHGSAMTRISWALDQFTGVDTSGANGSGAVVQQATQVGTSGVGSDTCTLLPFGNPASNATFFAAVAESNATQVWTAGAGMTKLAGTTGTTYGGIGTQYQVGQNLTPVMTWTTSGSIFANGGIGLELRDTGTIYSGVPETVVTWDNLLDDADLAQPGGATVAGGDPAQIGESDPISNPVAAYHEARRLR